MIDVEDVFITPNARDRRDPIRKFFAAGIAEVIANLVSEFCQSACQPIVHGARRDSKTPARVPVW